MAFNIDQINNQAELAIKALSEHLKKDEDDLLETDRGLWIHIQLAKTVETKTTKQIELPHSIYSEEGEVCLIVHNEPKKYQAIVDKMKLPRKVNVLSGKQFREKYQRFEAKRQIARDYDLFLIDSSLAHKITSLFGTSFAKSNKLPVITTVSRNKKIMNEKDMKENLIKALNTTNLSASFTDHRKIKFGHNHLTEEQLLDNFKAVLEELKTLDLLKFVQIISIQPDQSVSLPVYACVPGTWLVEDSIMEEYEKQQQQKEKPKPKQEKATKKKGKKISK